MTPKTLNPTRGFKTAAAYTALVLILLWAIGHPVREWAAVALVLYIALRLTMMVVVGAAAFAALRLAGYGRRVLQKYGVPLPDDQAAASEVRSARLLTAAVLAALLMLSTGVGLTVGFEIAALYGLSEFPSYLHWTAGALLAAGALGTAAALGIPAFVFVMADRRRQDWGAGTVRLQIITEDIARRRGWKFAT